MAQQPKKVRLSLCWLDHRKQKVTLDKCRKQYAGMEYLARQCKQVKWKTNAIVGKLIRSFLKFFDYPCKDYSPSHRLRQRIGVQIF